MSVVGFRMKILTIILLMLQVASLVAYEFCEDRSKDIAKGRIQCQQFNNGQYNQIQQRCDITCNPGYIAYPTQRVTCTSSRGQRTWRIDSNGNRVSVFSGTWSQNLDQVECRAPTSCPPVNQPLYGSTTCTKENGTTTCLRNCQYPYEVTEPQFQKEHCGPQTNFFWTHFLRNNVSTMPPCVPPMQCRLLQDTDMPEHGQMVCQAKDWADTVICKLNCERGYVLKPSSRRIVFCGPTTAFIWSHVHAARNSYARIGGCEQAPVTTEVTISLEKSCDQITKTERENGAEEMKRMIDSELLRIDANLNVSLIDWKVYCMTTVIQKSANTEENLSQKEPKTESPADAAIGSDQNSPEVNCPEVKLESASSEEPNLGGDDFVVDQTVASNNNSGANNPSAVEKISPTSSKQEEGLNYIVNATISYLTYSVYYNVNCVHGKCSEACEVLGLSNDDECFVLCMHKARSATQLVRHLPISYAAQVMKAIDVSTAQTIMEGGKFESLNVTSSLQIPYSLTQNDIQYIVSNQHNQYYQQSYNYNQQQRRRNNRGDVC